MAEADLAVAQKAAGIQVAQPGDLTTVGDLMACWLATQEDRHAEGDFAERSLAIRTQQSRSIAAELSGVKLDRLDYQALIGYRNRRLQKAAPATVQGEFVALRAAWGWARKAGHIENVELPRVPLKVVPRRETPPPKRAAIVAASMHLTGWVLLAVQLLEGTGCRLGEITGLTWDRVDLEREQIRVTGKTGPRIVPLPPSLVAILAAIPKGEGRIFTTSRPGVRIHAVLTRACKTAGVPHFSPQGLRKAAVIRLIRGGVDLATEAKMMGHSIETAFKHYYELDEEIRRDAVRSAGLGEQGTPSTSRPVSRRRVFRRIYQ